MADDTVTTEALQAELDTLKTALAGAEERQALLEAELAAEKAKAAKAVKKAKVAPKDKSSKPRKIGAMAPPKSEAEAADRAAALEAALGGPTELVYSDGQREIRELAPLGVGPDAWRPTPGGRVLHHEPLLEPGDCQRESFDLSGFGLLDAEGKQVGYCALPSPIAIGRNQRFVLPHNTIRF